MYMYIHIYVHIYIHIGGAREGASFDPWESRSGNCHVKSWESATSKGGWCFADKCGRTWGCSCPQPRKGNIHCNTLQHTATHCNTLHHTASHCTTLHHTATHCNTLQYSTTHCNALQHTAIFYWLSKSTQSRSHSHTYTISRRPAIGAKNLRRWRQKWRSSRRTIRLWIPKCWATAKLVHSSGSWRWMNSSVRCVTWMWRDSFLCVTWLIHCFSIRFTVFFQYQIDCFGSQLDTELNNT